MQEKQEFFSNAVEEDQDELLDELNELEADELAKEMNNVGPSHVPIAQQ